MSWDEDAAYENETETVDRVQIKHESQRTLASWIPGNQEPGIGDPTPAVTSQGSRVETNKKGSPRPGLGLLAAQSVKSRESLGTGLGLPNLKEQAPPLPCPQAPLSLPSPHPALIPVSPSEGLSLLRLPSGPF